MRNPLPFEVYWSFPRWPFCMNAYLFVEINKGMNQDESPFSKARITQIKEAIPVLIETMN